MIFNDIQPFIKNDGNPHWPGQIYKPKRHKARLYAEDPTCALCNKKIDMLENATLDHIVPRAHGGHTTRDNIQLAHLQCNYDKGHEL